MTRRYSLAIAGGGQLARMMQQAAIPLGIDVRLLAEGPGVSAAQVVPDTIVGDYRDLETLRDFVDGADALTFDHEHVPTRHLAVLEEQVAVRPGPGALVYAQDKAAMRERLTGLGAPCPAFAVCDTSDELLAFGERQGWPIIAKTSRGGYDGKGVWKLDGPAEVGIPFDGLASQSAGESVRIVAEDFIDFTRELSALVVRSPSGQVVAYPVSETLQLDGICVETVTPAPGLPAEEATRLQELAISLAGELGVVGVLAVELMQARDGRIVVNELAMRPHNTGHWSIDGAVTSQFENHLRAALDLPLGSPELTDEVVVMRNVLGGAEEDLTGALVHVYARDRAAHVHLYGKEVVPGRKVGHVTCVGTDLDDVRRRARHAAGYLMGDADA
ncbi:5-(carboxyamino)imidazole ribonucleotide synthase [Tessaracoccus palaemonis]|uniref:N5-carboxyaminoimidazole ribonucleotide synthase n=1 Tax=Tessaracoccus palaemonis TaxID=2829499 RepID=A0ABX8SL62_9ACTN|nr:5-(carboxyamino)imidazole ribonucleotide synthase [Tessaracoccus palaemonis]QXT63684.1 5-(carboxyamino)imidazole ribonucleotide synthase [Tessaracoccus palaemonis]